jgi:hypothetical protein
MTSGEAILLVFAAMMGFGILVLGIISILAYLTVQRLIDQKEPVEKPIPPRRIPVGQRTLKRGQIAENVSVGVNGYPPEVVDGVENNSQILGVMHEAEASLEREREQYFLEKRHAGFDDEEIEELWTANAFDPFNEEVA